MADEIIAEFEKNSKELVRVTLGEFQGKKLFQVRVYYPSGDEWLPGKQGISLSVERYRDLAEAILELGQVLKNSGLLVR